MAQRPLLKADRWVALLGVPTDEETLIQHYTLTQTELDLVQEKTAAYNQLGLAIQLCLIRHLGRSWQYEELLPAPMVAFVAEQIDVQTTMLAEYGRRSQTRREHAIEAQRHLGLHPAGREDRRAALLAAITTAAATDQGKPIAEAVIAAFRERHSLLPAAGTLDRIGRAGRAVARKRDGSVPSGRLHVREAGHARRAAYHRSRYPADPLRLAAGLTGSAEREESAWPDRTADLRPVVRP
jgi:Domain of unknown function (DUF4158)